jgi:glycerol uptake facilitator protein
MQRPESLPRECAAELLGTFLLVFFGTGSVFVGALTGALQGLFQVAIVWGIGIGLTIYAISAISGAHINPAVTIAAAVLRGFPRRKIVPYIGSQLVGAFIASALLLSMFSGILRGFEEDNKLIRGQAGSERAAMVFGQYFPNPAAVGTDYKAFQKVSAAQAMAAEAVGTALLVFFIFALTDDRNRNRPDGTFFAIFIGLTVTILISVLAPVSQASFNPARDFGPRLLSYFIGYGDIAIPGPRGGFFTVYILSPILGAFVGGIIYDRVIRAVVPPPATTAGRVTVDGQGLVTETTTPPPTP